MAPSPRLQKRNRSVVVADLDLVAISRNGGLVGDERVSSRSDSALAVYPGGDQDSRSAPTGKINGRRGEFEEEQEVESPERFPTGIARICSVIDPSMGLIHVKRKALVHDEDAPPGFGFISQPRNSFRSCLSAQVQVTPDQEMFEDLLPSPVPRVCGSSVHASRAAFSESTSKVKGSSVDAGPARVTALEDELLSTASFGKPLEGTYDSDNDAASVYHLKNDTVTLESEDGSCCITVTASHDVRNEHLHR